MDMSCAGGESRPRLDLVRGKIWREREQDLQGSIYCGLDFFRVYGLGFRRRCAGVYLIRISLVIERQHWCQVALLSPFLHHPLFPR